MYTYTPCSSRLKDASHYGSWVDHGDRFVTCKTLRQQTIAFRGSGGISEKNGSYGFTPAFLDNVTGRVHLARYADGRPAPMHLLDGLPPALVASRDARGRVVAAKSSVIPGFVRRNRFYTRAQAAALIVE